MEYIKRGLIHNLTDPDRHSMYLPTAIWDNELFDGNVRIYFSSFDKDMFGTMYYMDVDADNPSKVKYVSETPCLLKGEIGTFDDCGVAPSCVKLVDDYLVMFYIGFSRTLKAPQLIFSNICFSDKEGTIFTKNSPTPILDRVKSEIYVRSVPWVLKDTTETWYVASISGFVKSYKNKLSSLCTINSKGNYIPLKDNEIRIGRPCVIKTNDLYEMWYSIQCIDEPYKMGYATSLDGKMWDRQDDKALKASDNTKDFDYETVCYPCVIDVKDKRYMFYNGNTHGGTGIGYAEIQQ